MATRGDADAMTPTGRPRVITHQENGPVRRLPCSYAVPEHGLVPHNNGTVTFYWCIKCFRSYEPPGCTGSGGLRLQS